MFIKILTPNHNGKIELTVRDLEALIQEAVDKAIREKCSRCTSGYYYGGLTCVNDNIALDSDSDSTPKWEPHKVTCSGECASNAKIQTDDQIIRAKDIIFTSTINKVTGE